MKAMSAREAKHHFGQLIDEARADAVVVEKHGRPVVVVRAIAFGNPWAKKQEHIMNKRRASSCSMLESHVERLQRDQPDPNAIPL